MTAALTDPLEIIPLRRPVTGEIQPPGSKSLTNRALIVAALARGNSQLTGVLHSEDTHVMRDSLARLGISVVQEAEKTTLTVRGCGGNIPVDSADLWLENSGTSIRFLTALCALGHGRYVLDGNSRMRERPISPLVTALQAWGADLSCHPQSGCPPVTVNARGLPVARVPVSGQLSSQYLSALLLAAPCAKGPVEIAIEGELVSRPYIDMTLAVMRQFGAIVHETSPSRFTIEPTGYIGQSYAIEPDASAASYFFAVAAATGGEVTVRNLSRRALQGDVAFVDVLQQMGCDVQESDAGITVRGRPLRGVDVDMNGISDTAQTLAAIAPLASGPTRIRNVAHMRLKETDRVAALVNELHRLGIQAEEHPDGLTIHPGPTQPAVVQTYRDHRMAMSFAVLGLCRPGIRLADPGCTAKTYPDFFADLERLCRDAR